MKQSAKDIIEKLQLSPHPEGGYYRRVYRHTSGPADQGHASAIYYLVMGGNFEKWHRLQSDELWFWHDGAALTLEVETDDKKVSPLTLGPKVLEEQHPQILIPSGKWQRAKSHGEWTLVSCVVSPGFTFDIYEIVDDPDWHPSAQ